MILTEVLTHTATVNEVLPKAKIIKLTGFSGGNQDYSTAKKPPKGYKWKSASSLAEEEIKKWIDYGGWIGAVIPGNRIVIDIDNDKQGNLVKELLEGENIHHHSIKTPNGWQFIFAANEKETQEIKQIAKFYSQIGVILDTRTAENGYIVFPTSNTNNRFFVSKSMDFLDELPHFLKPIRNSTNVKDYVFTIPIKEQGNRNDSLYRWATHLRSWGVPDEELAYAMTLIYQYFVLDKTDFHFNELKTLVRSALNWEMAPTLGFSPEHDFRQAFVIPKPYFIQENKLFRTERKRDADIQILVSRITPTIKRELTNIERNSVHYEIAWKERGKEKCEIVPASVLATKRELMQLADYGLPVNDLNYKHLIDYFDKYLSINQLEQTYMVERLGRIKNAFIHPLQANGIEIVPVDIGEKQLLEAFQVKGTANSWIAEIFERIKNHPKVLFFVLASFTSVILTDLKITPFIVDLSGSTSQGKTTALQVARSVWGTENLINEWNTTKVAIERKSGFLNNFPLFMDDTRKAKEKDLQSIIYQFSGGRSKGRGSVRGAQKEETWNNILLSTGEISLNDYTNKAGGAAARIIPLVDEPFVNVGPDYFSGLYQALNENYGAIGLAFLSEWEQKKEDLIPQFHKFIDFYLNNSQGNEVLRRLSRYYAAIHFTGSVLKQIFNLEVNLSSMISLFDEISEENKSLDKPKELLEEILLKLDSTRRVIYYSERPYVPDEIKAIYKFDTLCLMPAFLKEFLGVEEKMIRREWLKRGFTEGFDNRGKIVDYKTVFINGKSFRVVVINKSVIKELGLDFKETIEPFR